MEASVGSEEDWSMVYTNEVPGIDRSKRAGEKRVGSKIEVTMKTDVQEDTSRAAEHCQ